MEEANNAIILALKSFPLKLCECYSCGIYSEQQISQSALNYYGINLILLKSSCSILECLVLFDFEKISQLPNLTLFNPTLPEAFPLLGD